MVATISLSRILCDFTVLVATAIPLLIFHEYVTPYKRGFYCDDESIRYPYHKSTVTRQLLIIVGILIPTILILMTEVLRTLRWERNISSQFGTYRVRNYNVHRLIVRLYVFIGYFFLGVCFNQLMVDIGKYTIGRQRPHFMEVCKPDKGYVNCPSTDHTYITDFNCTGTNEYLIHEAQLSFYSGHAAFSFYAAWYTTFYLQARLYRPLYSRLILPVLQFSLFAGAIFVSLSRVSDYKHHWSDVLVGAAMGSTIGIINALFIAEVFEKREVPHEFRRAHRTLGYRPSIEEQQQRHRNLGGDKFEELKRPLDQQQDLEKGRYPSVMRPAYGYPPPAQSHRNDHPHPTTMRPTTNF